MKRRAVFLVSLLILVMLVLGGCNNNPQRKPQDEEQAQTKTYSTLLAEAAANPHENGCVSCHKKTNEVDRSLPAYVKRISGHPEVKESTVNACYFCHEAEKNYNLYKEFYKGMHKSHWGSETFYKKSEGTCASCHTVEKNGVSGIKDYPLAGYRNLGAKAAAPKEKAAPKTTPEQPKTRQQGQPEAGEQQEEAPQQQEEEETTPNPTPGP